MWFVPDRIMNKRNFLQLMACVALPLAVGFTGSIFTRRSISDGWYASLNQPSFNPPDDVFGPVWTVLYVLMGISLYRVLQEAPGRRRENAAGVFGLQLLLNFLWSFFFFYFKDIEIAMLDIVALWVSVVVMIVLFYRLNPLAAYLNIPYLLWVSFATVLNGAYYVLN